VEERGGVKDWGRVGGEWQNKTQLICVSMFPAASGSCILTLTFNWTLQDHPSVRPSSRLACSGGGLCSEKIFRKYSLCFVVLCDCHCPPPLPQSLAPPSTHSLPFSLAHPSTVRPSSTLPFSQQPASKQTKGKTVFGLRKDNQKPYLFVWKIVAERSEVCWLVGFCTDFQPTTTQQPTDGSRRVCSSWLSKTTTATGTTPPNHKPTNINF
jgi:hypothetical protein